MSTMTNNHTLEEANMRTENIKLLDLDDAEILNYTYKHLLGRAIDMLNKCYEHQIEPYNNQELAELIVNTEEAQQQIQETLLRGEK